MMIILNGREQTIEDAETISYEHIVELVTGRKGDTGTYSVIYQGKRVGDSQRSGTLYAGKSCELEGGMIFSAMITGSA